MKERKSFSFRKWAPGGPQNKCVGFEVNSPKLIFYIFLLARYVTLDKLLKLSLPQFLHVLNGNNNIGLERFAII